MKLRIGTRGSALALAQCELVTRELKLAAPDVEIELVPLVTSGDLKQSAPESTPRDKSDWIDEIERKLLVDSIDLAVHSGKDVPVEVDSATRVRSILPRGPAVDCYFCHPELAAEIEHGRTLFEALPRKAVVGTSSLRRKAQLLRHRPDLEVIAFRGNVNTRLDKFSARSDMSAIVLAQAGIERLPGVRPATGKFTPEQLLPAVTQGILALHFLRENSKIADLAEKLSHPQTEACWTAERAVIRRLLADCNSAVAAFAVVQDGEIWVRSEVLAPDGTRAILGEARGALSDADRLGNQVGTELLELGAEELLRQGDTK